MNYRCPRMTVFSTSFWTSVFPPRSETCPWLVVPRGLRKSGCVEAPCSLVEETGRRPFETGMSGRKTFTHHPVIRAWGTTFAQHLCVQVVFRRKTQGLTFQSGDSHSLHLQKDGRANGQRVGSPFFFWVGSSMNSGCFSESGDRKGGRWRTREQDPETQICSK